MVRRYEERTVKQVVNGPDGSKTEINVVERRLVKSHAKQMAKLQARQRRATDPLEPSAPSPDPESPEVESPEVESPAADELPTEE
jgi:hypothetical protein